TLEELETDIDEDDDARGQPIELADIEITLWIAGQVYGRHARDAVEAAEKDGADGKTRARGLAHYLRADQGREQGHDAHIGAAESPIEHEVAKGRGERGRQGNRREKREGTVAEIDGRYSKSVGAGAEEGGLAEAHDAATAPNVSEAQRVEREDGVE